MTTEFSEEQTEVLLRPLSPSRVSQRQGFSYLEAWDVRAHLIRLFGFGGFDVITESCDLVYERDRQVGGKDGWEVAYKAHVTLRVRGWDDLRDTTAQDVAQYSEFAIGSAVGASGLADLHDNAAKSAVSDAMKRCAINLGTQFGLSLYDNGTTSDVVKKIVGRESADTLTPEQQRDLRDSLGATPIKEEGE